MPLHILLDVSHLFFVNPRKDSFLGLSDCSAKVIVSSTCSEVLLLVENTTFQANLLSLKMKNTAIFMQNHNTYLSDAYIFIIN